MFKTKTSNIGLDISRSGIKMVQFRKGVLTGIAYKEIPVSVRKGTDKEFFMFVSKSISTMIREGNFEGRNVSSNLTGPDEVNVLFLTLPKMEKRDIEGALSLEIRKSASFPTKSSVYDFYSREVLYHEDELRIICAVSGRDVVDNKIALFERARLLTMRLDIAGHAIENLLGFTGELSDGEVSLFLDIGTSLTTMNFFSGNIFQFSRELPFGSDDLTSSITKPVVTPDGRITLSFEDAEALKKEHGIIVDGSKETIIDSIPASQLSAMMRPFVERVSREINNSINHFRRLFNGKVEKIFLYGGAAKLKGLDELISKNSKIEVSEFDPFGKAAVELPENKKELFENFKLDFVVSAGLALGGKRKFNILPAGIRRLHKLLTVRTGIAVGLVIFAVALFSAFTVVHIHIKGFQERIQANKAYLAPLEDKLSAMKELEIWEKKVERREKVISGIQRAPVWHGVLKELSSIIPEGIVLKSIRLVSSPDGGMGLNIKGNLTSEKSAFSRFLVNLNDSPFFKDVVLVSRREEEGGEIKFELKCSLIY